MCSLTLSLDRFFSSTMPLPRNTESDAYLTCNGKRTVIAFAFNFTNSLLKNMQFSLFVSNAPTLCCLKHLVVQQE